MLFRSRDDGGTANGGQDTSTTATITLMAEADTFPESAAAIAPAWMRGRTLKINGSDQADVILVGELRGRETMKMALQLASFGILIFATVHTNSAPATIDRFVNAFPASQQPQIRGMLSDSLAGIVAQQLLRTADGSGRLAAQEILIGTPGVAAAIREAKTSMLQSLIQGGGQYGMRSMDAELGKLVAEGKVRPEHALEKATDKDSFAKIPAVAAALKA